MATQSPRKRRRSPSKARTARFRSLPSPASSPSPSRCGRQSRSPSAAARSPPANTRSAWASSSRAWARWSSTSPTSSKRLPHPSQAISMPSASRTQIPPEVEAIDYAERWRDIVERRRVQMEAANAESGISSADYWSKRAKTYRQALHDRTDEDPFFLRVREAITRDTTLIDVGAGTGRHTLALAPLVNRIVAVDPSPAMLALLRQDLAEQDIDNVDVIESEWMQADVERAEIVICSHVLYPIADVVPFVLNLQ